MDTMIVFYGLKCDTCPILLATLEPDESRRLAMKESIAEICSNQYGINLQPADISDCDGCLSQSGRLFSGCQTCGIRKCAILKNIESCAFCNDYVCPTLQNHLLHATEAQAILEEIRQAYKP